MKIDKKKLLIIICSVILVIFIILLILNRKDRVQEKLTHYIQQKDFIQDAGTLYKNKDNNLESCNEQIENDCESIGRFFDTNKYTYFISKNIKKSDVFFEIVLTYSYRTTEMYYTYRSTYKNGVLMYRGTYNNEKESFTCDLDYSYGVDANKDTICNYIKSEVDIFYEEAKVFITDSYLLNKTKNSN